MAIIECLAEIAFERNARFFSCFKCLFEIVKQLVHARHVQVILDAVASHGDFRLGNHPQSFSGTLFTDTVSIYQQRVRWFPEFMLCLLSEKAALGI